MRAGIQEEALRAMLEGGAVREVLVSRHGEQWGLAIRLGGAGSRWLQLRSREVGRTSVSQATGAAAPCASEGTISSWAKASIAACWYSS